MKYPTLSLPCQSALEIQHRQTYEQLSLIVGILKLDGLSKMYTSLYRVAFMGRGIDSTAVEGPTTAARPMIAGTAAKRQYFRQQPNLLCVNEPQRSRDQQKARFETLTGATRVPSGRLSSRNKRCLTKDSRITLREL